MTSNQRIFVLTNLFSTQSRRRCSCQGLAIQFDRDRRHKYPPKAETYMAHRSLICPFARRSLLPLCRCRVSLANALSLEILLIIACACIPTLKPIYDRHIRRHRTQQQRKKNKLLSMPGARQPSRQQRYQPLPMRYNEDEAGSLSSTPVSQPPRAISGGRIMREESGGMGDGAP